MTENPASKLTLAARVYAARAKLSPAELRTANYMIANPQEVLFETAETIGAGSKSSDATVVRTVQSLGYKGLQELKRELAHELSLRTDPADRLQERLHRTREHSAGFMNAVFEEAATRLRQIQETLDPHAFQAAVDLLLQAGSIYTWGLGSVSHEAQYAALRLRRLGLRAFLINSTGFNLGDDLLLQRMGDVIVVYARGRRTKDIDAIIDNARSVGGHVLLITASLAEELADRVDVVLEMRDTHSGLTREAFGASMITDAIMLSIAEGSEASAVQTSRKLSLLRNKLLG